MNGRNVNWVKTWLMPVAIACCVMALVLLTVPMTGTPATVMGGYGGGGGSGGGNYIANGPAVLPYYYVVQPPPVSLSANTFTITILRQYVVLDNIDLSSLALNGVKPLKAEFTSDGLVLTIDFKALNLAAGTDHITLTGKYTDGREFSITISIWVTS